MDSEDDFTFFQVPPLDNHNGLELKNLASDVGHITLEEKSSNNPSDDQNRGVLWKDNSAINLVPKEETLGSLSFSVIDASSSKKPNESTKQTASADPKTSTKDVEVPKASAKKPATRAKVPFEKGYSPMDWMKLTRTHPDLAGLKGQSNRRLISMDEVKKNQSEGSMWTVLKGQVYNIAPYMKFHPGGVDFLMKAVGKDCTSLFNKYHAWVNAEFLLEKCLVGKLDDGR